MSKPNGGFAFPTHIWHGTQQGGQYLPVGGMSLRDFFAAKAMSMAPAMTAYNMRDNESRPDFIARHAYELADAMLKAR